MDFKLLTFCGIYLATFFLPFIGGGKQVQCQDKERVCDSHDHCIPEIWFCDGDPDCPDRSDESDAHCSGGKQMQCKDKARICDSQDQCIPEIWFCDGEPDCIDGSDESDAHCPGGKQMLCKDKERVCDSQAHCIPEIWFCDGQPDCPDRSDESEAHCSGGKQMQCKDKERICDSQDHCIPEFWFCDGEPDCLDLSDESDINCPDANYTCAYPSRKCEKNATHVCVNPEQLCDGINHCDDAHFDEGEECNNKMCDHESNPCSDLCYNTPEAPGFMCACNVGKKLNTDHHTCIPAVPVDKICDQWGICGQACMLDRNVTHGYRCTCLDGFVLEPDEFTCKLLDSDPVYVIFSNRHELRQVDVATRHAITLISGLRNTIALDFYYKDGVPVLFWADVMEDKIYKGTMAGNNLINVEAIIKSGLAKTEGVAIDWVGENIYWVDCTLGQIEVAKLDGSNRTTLIAGEMTNPRAIVVDPSEGSLFWTDWDDHNPRIEKCSMSGEGRNVIHKIIPGEGGGLPNGLTVDYDFKRLYWIDARSKAIHSVDYYGGDHRLILKGHTDMTHPFAISLFGNNVYWTDWRTHSVVRANKFNGSDVQIVQKTINTPFDLQVVHPKRQPLMENPCAVNNGGCSDFCLINYNRTVGCRCPQRKKLGNDNKKCVGGKQVQCKDKERACYSQDRCIPEIWFCDGEPDCLDRSDESDVHCPDVNYTCAYPSRKCEKNATHICVNPEHLCDGINHCDDVHVDEGGECNNKMCDHESNPCSDLCYNTPEVIGFICACNVGEKLNTDHHTCIPAVPVDKLCDQRGICSQACMLDRNVAHGYRCTCHDGFVLEPDGFTCKPLESDPVYVIFSTRHELRQVDVATRNAITLISGLTNTIALDFYYKDGVPVLFWADMTEKKIYRGTMAGNNLINVEVIIKSGIVETEGVAIDWVGENIYWVDSSLGQIEVAKLDGSNRTTLIAGEMTSPRAIVVDPIEGALFWTDWDSHNPRIEKCSMSGEGRSVIHRIIPAEGGGWPNGLTVDYVLKRLFWIDARSKSIHSVDYYGGDHRLILKGHTYMRHPFAISLFENHVYWTDWSTHSVVMANKFNGSDVQIVQKTISTPFDLQVVHPKRQPLMDNPCAVNNGGCSDLCLINYNRTVGCRCPERKKLGSDNKKCVDDVEQYQSLATVTESDTSTGYANTGQPQNV